MADSKHRTLSAETGFFTLTGFPAQATVHAPLPADHPFYGMVGRVASEWAHLEHVLDLVIWELADGKQNRLACITAQIMGVGPRCKVIGTLGRLRGLPEPLLKRSRALANESYTVADWRARWVHDPWYMAHESDQPGQFRSMPAIDPRYGIQDIDQAELEDTIHRISELREKAGILRHDVLDELSTLR